MLLFDIIPRPAMCSSQQKFIIRLPGELHTQFKHIAKRENRSMNNEIVDRLEKSLVSDEARQRDEKIIALLLRKVEALEHQLKNLQINPPEPEHDSPAVYARS
ncbi:Arc family DNA-binding protein [Pseudomonas sp. Au-Pse12]|uniref:Arc family DNA-binding protein n=1 Tax=Pseudomonas sp. Au-Pse12 TaxID=2906459 RepID=UPI001E28B91D|nr:Arc family DNA-binding protein [Pseudomonas sp. Au-Pse12]MCE4058363.1 Arc family DNA-binding protein [Pseudomonas sp. Au-Pse12]